MPILGTSVDSIDLAEDRDRFKRLLDKLGLKQPKNGIAYSVEQSRLIAADLGLPLVVRPSYVLGGRAMAIIHDRGAFDDYLLGMLPSLVPSDVKARYPNDKTGQINTVLGKNPLLFDRYLSDAIEIDVDALCDGKTVFVAGIMEHIEEAGIHSGDSACSLPPRSLSPETIAELEAADAEAGAGARRRRPDERAICAEGRRDLRARSQPARLAHGAVRRQGDRPADRQDRQRASWRARARLVRPQARQLDHVGVKEAVFPFARFPGVDTVLGPEMRSTGEVMGLDRSFEIAFAKSQLGAGAKVADVGHGVRLGARRRQGAHRRAVAQAAGARLQDPGDRRHPALPDGAGRAGGEDQQGLGRPPACGGRDPNGGVQLVFNTTEGRDLARRFQAPAPRRPLAKDALLHHFAGAIAAAQGIRAYRGGDLEVRALQDYLGVTALIKSACRGRYFLYG